MTRTRRTGSPATPPFRPSPIKAFDLARRRDSREHVVRGIPGERLRAHRQPVERPLSLAARVLPGEFHVQNEGLVRVCASEPGLGATTAEDETSDIRLFCGADDTIAPSDDDRGFEITGGGTATGTVTATGVGTACADAPGRRLLRQASSGLPSCEASSPRARRRRRRRPGTARRWSRPRGAREMEE